MKEFDVKDIIRFLNFISKNGIYVCSSQDLFNDIKFPFERKNFVSIISIISNRLLKPLSREIEYSLTCPRKPFRASLSPSLEVYTSNTGRKYRDRFILSCTRNRQRIQPRRGALNRSSKLIAHVIGHFITSITGDIQGIVYKYFFSAHSTESNNLSGRITAALDGRPNGFLSSVHDPLFKMVARDRIYGNVIYLFAIIELFAGKRLLSTSGTRAYVITEDIYQVIRLRLFLLFLPRSSSSFFLTSYGNHANSLSRAYTYTYTANRALRVLHSFDREGTHRVPHVPLPCQ